MLLLVTPGAARAETTRFPPKNRWLVVADNLFGLQSVNSPPSPNESPARVDSFSLMGSRGAGPLTMPHLGVHFASRTGVTVGLGAARSHQTGMRETTYDPGLGPIGWVSEQEEWLVAPRVGYITGLSGRWLLWPRAGLTYDSLRQLFVSSIVVPEDTSREGGGKSWIETKRLSLSLSLPLGFTPAEHLVFFAGPAVEVPLLATRTFSAPSRPVEVGVQVGLLAYF